MKNAVKLCGLKHVLRLVQLQMLSEFLLNFLASTRQEVGRFIGARRINDLVRQISVTVASNFKSHLIVNCSNEFNLVDAD